MVGLPKDEGGLGVLDITVQNECLLMKHLHKFYNRAQIPWVQLVWDKYYSRNRLPVHSNAFRGSFWWRDLLKLLAKFKGLAVVSIQDGKSWFLWHDLWGPGVYSQLYPELYSFVRNGLITLSVAASTPLLYNLFHLPLSPEAHAQFTELSNILQGLHL